MYWEVWTPSVYRILDQLDKEKMDVLEHLGYERLNYFDACKYRNSLDDSIDARAVFEEYAASPYRAKGPVVVDSRYISEAHAREIKDIPYDRVNRGTGKRYQSQVYTCRKDEAGKKLDKAAMLICSKALGHNRISVVADNYIRGL